MLTLLIWRIQTGRTAQLLLAQMTEQVRSEQCHRTIWGGRNKQMAAVGFVTTGMPTGGAGGRNHAEIAGIARG